MLLLALASGAAAAGSGNSAAAAGGTPMPGGMVTVFAAECNAYMDWQSITVVYTHRKAGVPGPIYRILTCSEEHLKTYRNVDIVPTHVSPSWTHNERNNDNYLAYNKPGALMDWLDKAPPKEQWVLVIDPDMIIRDSFNDWGRVYGADRGWAVSLFFGYMKESRGVANNLSATHVPEVAPREDHLAGPRGRRGDMASGVVLMHRDDLKRVAPLWMHYSETVRDDPLGFNETGDEFAKRAGQKPWISEMYGYSFGAAKADVWHRVDYQAQLYPGYLAYDKPLILHYGRLWQVGAWKFQKHWFRTFTALQCPPWPHMSMLLTGQEVAPNVTGGLFPHPPHPSEFANEPPAEQYKQLLSISVVATINAALCEQHLQRCPASKELTDTCAQVKSLEHETDAAIQAIEQDAPICVDRKPEVECRNWAARRLCWQDTGFMHNWCRATCGLCRVPAGRLQVAFNESLPGGKHAKQRGGRREQLPQRPLTSSQLPPQTPPQPRPPAAQPGTSQPLEERGKQAGVPAALQRLSHTQHGGSSSNSGRQQGSMVSVTTRAAAADAALCTTSDSRRAEWEAWGMLPGGQQAAGAAALKGMHVREASLPPPISTAAAPSSPGIATPAISPTHAASTPTATVAAATDAAAALRAEASQQGDVAAAGSGAAPCDAALLRRRVQSFVQCVSRSPLVKSALLSLEAGGTHPAACPDAPATSTLEWTLAQLLALHLRADFPRASESTLLASLWVLEACHSSERSLCTICLESYLRLLALFSEELVLRITADWPASFCKLRSAVVAAQADLLARLGWRTLLRFEEEVAPCHRLLFGAPADGPAWAPALHAALCAVRQQAEFVRTDGVARAAASRQHSRPPTPEGGAAPRPAKRCRSAS
ncbi:peptidyl serine alpha-galactosyltransferase [Micractinium conductrix]|uniref:Peptidyl serine alpha-galactosyltransferase n=1 Tax=Micractinium conductrix TaxID=554055 RepID=A0A2P6VPY1_9CHLO|nr:peptidyl serine alpha-galactosyltransferase [Micractinium conductrix]|eukprot:PSC76158.1 peptidyl serine alpha-galactosyltransferase [Micractinium conductrix]